MLSNLDLFTVKVFKVPENDMLKESNKPDVTEKERPFPLTDMHLIEEHHNMTSARVIRVSSFNSTYMKLSLSSKHSY